MATTTDPAAGPRPVHRAGQTATNRRRQLVKHILLLAFGAIMLYPLLWMLTSSFKPTEQILADPSLIIREFTLENFRKGWNALDLPFSVFAFNSFIVTLGSILGNLLSCSLAAYAFARLNFWARKYYFAMMLATIMLPFHVLVVPQYIVFSSLDLVNTFYPLVIPKFLATDAFFVFLMVQFIRTIPKDLDRAAWLDGAGSFRVFWHVILPLMTPALTTTAIFTFIWTWNDFFTPLIYLTSTPAYTMPVALSTLLDSQTQQGTGYLFAMSVLSLIPIFIFFIGAQKYLIRGISTTGLK